jgi:penicillin-binding protein 1A
MASWNPYKPSGRPRIALTNRRRGGWVLSLLRAAVVVPGFAIALIALAAAPSVGGFVAEVGEAPDIREPVAGHASEIWSTDGTRVGGLLRGRRPWVGPGEVPARVKMAFVAAEDDAFFEHDGFDAVAIARAYLRNRAAGRVVEGGSTITQQLAKRFLTHDKTYSRKLTELVVARRIERAWSKEAILTAYLNEVYLGAGAHGIQAAAEIYFDKELAELEWDEVTLLAGITTSPSSLNPFRRPERAKARRRLVLRRLVSLGVMEEAEAQRYADRPLILRKTWDGDEDTMPYPSVSVRESLRRVFGAEAMQNGGFQVTVAASPLAQKHARTSLSRGLRELDRRQGYRGPLSHLPEALWPELDAASRAVYPALGASTAVKDGRPYVALVTHTAPHELRVRLAGQPLTIPRDGTRWAAPYELSARSNERTLTDVREILKPGDVVLVAHDVYPVWDLPPGKRGRGAEARQVTGWRLDQVPKVEGVLVSAEVETGYVRAALGGWDFDRSEFNRVEGCRQPGSVFKPIVYSRALEKGLTPATVLSDTPIKIEKAGGEVWRPKNADNDFDGFLLLRDALAKSRNLPSIEVFRHIGAAAAADQAYRLGITTPMTETEALSLGASCVKPWDMARVYGTFARRGVRMEPRMALTIRGRTGAVVHDVGHYADPSASSVARWARLARAQPVDRPLGDRHAFMLLQMLRAVVYGGTAYAATELGVPAAGKTGTTNAYDAWFIGFTQSVVTVVWSGADGNERPLGKRESGGRVALPSWLRYMTAILDGRKQGDLVGEVPEGIEIRRVDRELGLLAKPGEPGIDLPFIVGTAPERFAPDRKEKEVKRVDRVASEY